MSHAAPVEQTAPPPATGPLDRKRLFTAFCLTPLLAGFYPAIFLAEPSLMLVGLVLAYVSTAVFGIPLVAYFDRASWDPAKAPQLYEPVCPNNAATCSTTQRQARNPLTASGSYGVR